ncbi:MAG: Na/Pi cotransporter family protein [Desulfobulbaceae bacterium]|uniref:Na/Pi cotransporter family protein n=1 Tax=Candidatus Desulfatifera sulfidica TaxID=2841691 RepID=A0A8J6TAM1_9BACT|nr:Na/Pi cotransporter family protein [Candidatus Desulfatifera sulfidica]
MNFDIWQLLAGLGVFLYGMFLLEDAVKNLSGRAFRRLIRHYTNGRLRAIGSGALVTAILQSSSAVSLMVLAFVGAGVMTMGNGIGVMLGSNVGTTFTAWIVATLGFKVQIETFALPLVGVGGVSLVIFASSPRIFQFARLLVGFGFLFLGLDYMKTSVEGLAAGLDLAQFPDYGMLAYLVIGLGLTALMQSSSASIAIALTALNSGLISFEIGTAMVIGANLGTTVTVMLGSLGGIQAKKRVAWSHLVFNMATGLIALLFLPVLVALVGMVVDIEANSVMGLALFHTLFNCLGVLVFFPFIGLLADWLIRFVPDQRVLLTAFLNNATHEIPDAATAALRNEVHHLLQESQLYNLRLLRIDESLVFNSALPFEHGGQRRQTIGRLYDNIKLLHAEIFAFFARLQSQELDEGEVREIGRIVYSSRNIMNSLKNFKGVRKDMDEFDASENSFITTQYQGFRKRLVDLYLGLNRIMDLDNYEEQYRQLLRTFVHIETDDRNFVQATMNAVTQKEIKEMEIASLLLVNRLFSQACRMQVFSIKDLFLDQDHITAFDRALDMKEIIDEERGVAQRSVDDLVEVEKEGRSV